MNLLAPAEVGQSVINHPVKRRGGEYVWFFVFAKSEYEYPIDGDGEKWVKPIRHISISMLIAKIQGDSAYLVRQDGNVGKREPHD